MTDNDPRYDGWKRDSDEFNRPETMGPEPFDAFEVQTVGEYSDNEGGTFMEPLVDGEEDEERLGIVFTVYGHRRNQGVWAITDHETRQDALDMAAALAAGRVEVHDYSFDLRSTADPT